MTAKKASPDASGLSKTPRRLPRQGETQMVAFIRDPRCIFTYWEVTPESVEEVKRQLMEEYGKSSMVLRVLRANAHGEMELFQEILVKPGEMNRYVELAEASGSYQVEIAQKAPSGRLVVYARSNRVVTGLVPGNGSVPARGGDPQTEVPAAFMDYFDEEGEVIGTRVTPGGPISSAEAYRLDILRKKRDHYAASRLR